MYYLLKQLLEYIVVDKLGYCNKRSYSTIVLKFFFVLTYNSTITHSFYFSIKRHPTFSFILYVLKIHICPFSFMIKKILLIDDDPDEHEIFSHCFDFTCQCSTNSFKSINSKSLSAGPVSTLPSKEYLAPWQGQSHDF